MATAVAALPFAYLLLRAGGDGWAGVSDTLLRSRTLELTLRSLELAALVTAACLVVGVAMALLVARTDLPGRRLVQVLVALPLALPSYVAALGWLGVDRGLQGRGGSVLVLAGISYPYVYLPVLAALRRCDPALEEAARSLGHRPLSVLGRVVLPQIRLAAAGGGLLVGLYVLSDFGAVATMRHEVLTFTIFRSYRGSFDRTPPAVLGCLLAVLAIVIVVVEARLRRGRDASARVGSGAARPQPTVRLGRLRWPALLLPVGLLAVTLGGPGYGVWRWFDRGRSRADGEQLVEATVSTLQVGALGAVVVVALAFPAAVLAVRHPGRLAGLARGATYAGHALPGVVVGLSLVFFGINVARPVYQELPLLVLAYGVLFMSLGYGAIHGAIAQVPRGLEDAARSLGRTPFGVWRAVTARLAAPGIAAGATLVALTVMKELPATLFLRPTGFDTLATRLWGHTTSQSFAAAAPYALAVVLVAALPTALLAVSGERAGRRRS